MAYTKYSEKERQKYFAERCKVGAVDKEGKPLSDFQRGRAAGRMEEIGKKRGQYKYRVSDDKGKAEIRARQQEIKAERAASRAAYKAQKAADKAFKKGGKNN